MDNEEFVYAPAHITVIRDKEGEPGVGVEDTLTPACDFCLDVRTKWTYDCPDFELPEIGFGSTLGWLACERCAELIEQGDLPGLTNRSVRSWRRRMGDALPEQVTTIAMIQAGFWKHHPGTREAYG